VQLGPVEQAGVQVAVGVDDGDVPERRQHAVAPVGVGAHHLMGDPVLVQDGDPDPCHRPSGVRDRGALDDGPVVVLQEGDPGVQPRGGQVHCADQLACAYLIVHLHRLHVGDRPPGIGVVGRIAAGVGVVVGGAVHQAEVAHVPALHGRDALQAAGDAGQPLLALPHVVGAVAHEGPVEHGVVEQVGVLDGVADDIVVRGDLVQRDLVPVVVDRVDVVIVIRDVVAIHPLVRQLGRRIEDVVGGGGEGEEAAVHRDVADVVPRDLPDLVVDGDQLVLVQTRKYLPGRHVLGVGGTEGVVQLPVHLGVAPHLIHVVRRMGQDVLEPDGVHPMGGHRGQHLGASGGVAPYVVLHAPHYEQGDGPLLGLGHEERPGEVVAVLEVVGDRRMGALLDGLEAVVPPGDERGTVEGDGRFGVLGGEPSPRGRPVLVREGEPIAERP